MKRKFALGLFVLLFASTGLYAQSNYLVRCHLDGEEKTCDSNLRRSIIAEFEKHSTAVRNLSQLKGDLSFVVDVVYSRNPETNKSEVAKVSTYDPGTHILYASRMVDSKLVDALKGVSQQTKTRLDANKKKYGFIWEIKLEPNKKYALDLFECLEKNKSFSPTLPVYREKEEFISSDRLSIRSKKSFFKLRRQLNILCPDFSFEKLDTDLGHTLTARKK